MKIFFDRGLNANLKTRIASLVTTGGAKIINREPKPDSDAIQVAFNNYKPVRSVWILRDHYQRLNLDLDLDLDLLQVIQFGCV